MSTIPRYLVWNSGKANGAVTVTELRAYEKENGGSVSSIIEAHDIGGLIEAVYNETDIKLLYKAIA